MIQTKKLLSDFPHFTSFYYSLLNITIKTHNISNNCLLLQYSKRSMLVVFAEKMISIKHKKKQK